MTRRAERTPWWIEADRAEADARPHRSVGVYPPICRCGCGGRPGRSDGTWCGGHDTRALHRVIIGRWGSIEAFLDWHEAATLFWNRSVD